MPRYTYLSVGSNTTIKTGAGQVFGVIVGGANGGSVAIVDSISIGATPNLLTQVSNSSNIAYLGTLTAAPDTFALYGAAFQVGLTVAATSNAPVTVFYE